MNPVLTMLVPAYNEESSVVSTLDSLQAYLAGIGEPYELIIVDDGSTDSTAQVVTDWCTGHPREAVRLLMQATRQGKGAALAAGCAEAHGSYILFTDADLPYELDSIRDFLAALQNGADVAAGSRMLTGSRLSGVPGIRYAAGRVFSWFVELTLGLGISDTQCGFKAFRSHAAKQLFPKLTIRGFGFDMEILYLAKLSNLTVVQVPVRMRPFRLESRVRIVRDSIRMFAELFKIRLNDARGRYS